MQSHSWIDFGISPPSFFCKFLQGTSKKDACKIILTPTTKEPKVCHALVTTSALNLKLCSRIQESPFAIYLYALNNGKSPKFTKWPQLVWQQLGLQQLDTIVNSKPSSRLDLPYHSYLMILFYFNELNKFSWKLYKLFNWTYYFLPRPPI